MDLFVHIYVHNICGHMLNYIKLDRRSMGANDEGMLSNTIYVIIESIYELTCFESHIKTQVL